MKKKLIVLFVLLFITPVFATVSTGESIREYFDGDGNTVAFTFTQPANSADDILVYSHINLTGVETLQVQDTDYTIVPTGGDYRNGGVVTFGTAPANTVDIAIVRSIKKSQETAQGAITPTSIVAVVDKITRILQDLQDRNDRSIHLQESDAETFDMEIPGLADRAETYLFFDATGALTFVANVILDTINASAFGTTLVQTASASTARGLLELDTDDAVQFAAITGTTGTFSGAVGITGDVTLSGDVGMANSKALTVETITAVDATGIVLEDKDGVDAILVNDGGTVTLTDSSQMASSAAPTTDADIANKKYVDDQIVAADPTAKAWCQFSPAGALRVPDFNVTSTSTTGTGKYTVTWDTDFSTTNYMVFITAITTTGAPLYANAIDLQTGTCTFEVHDENAALANAACSVLAFGNQ